MLELLIKERVKMADFINRVTEHFDELTKSHKEVANYFSKV